MKHKLSKIIASLLLVFSTASCDLTQYIDVDSLGLQDIANFRLENADEVQKTLPTKEVVDNNKKVTINFYSFGNICATYTINKGKSCVAPEAPSVSGFSFVGWYLDKQYTEEYYSSYPANNKELSTINVYAKYKSTSTSSYDLSNVSFKDTSIYYDGYWHTLEVEGNVPNGVVVSYPNGNTFINVGVYTVIVEFRRESNNGLLERWSATLTIKESGYSNTASYNVYYYIENQYNRGSYDYYSSETRSGESYTTPTYFDYAIAGYQMNYSLSSIPSYIEPNGSTTVYIYYSLTNSQETADYIVYYYIEDPNVSGYYTYYTKDNRHGNVGDKPEWTDISPTNYYINYDKSSFPSYIEADGKTGVYIYYSYVYSKNNKSYLEADFSSVTYKSTSYYDYWTYGDFTIYGASNNDGAYSFIKVGPKNSGSFVSTIQTTNQISLKIQSFEVTICGGSYADSTRYVSSWMLEVFDCNGTLIDTRYGSELLTTGNIYMSHVYTFYPGYTTGATYWPTDCTYRLSMNVINNTSVEGTIRISKIQLVEK